MKRTKDITVIGAAIIDIIAAPVSAEVFQSGSSPVKTTKLSFGGDALNEAVVLARLGKQAELISKVGEDEAGKHVLDYIQENRVGMDGIQKEAELTTGMNIVLVDEAGERFFLTNPEGSLRKLSEEDIVPYLEQAADIVSFASMFVSPLLDVPAMERLFQKCKEKKGRILATDMTKAKHGERLEDLCGLLPYVDYLFANRDEIALLTGKTDPDVNAKLFVEAGVFCVIIKLGGKGCLIRTKDLSYRIPAYPVQECADTTGAGDAFAAGFLWGISQGLSVKDCGMFACAVASCIVECVGATEGISSAEEPMKRFRWLKYICKKGS